MLVGLHVKNLALIEQADVEFGNGLNILTGETGAGKSIIIGSVALALGAKASRDMIRCGEEYAYIELIFSVDDEKKREELKRMDVYPDEDGLLIISKKITQTRSISRINDETVTTARLKAVTGKLLDIHGQHEHQSLLHKQKHLEILDEYSWRETGSLKRNVAESYRRYLELKGKLDGLSLDEESRKRELDFVRFEIDEIEDSALKPGEEEELAAKFRKFSHSQKIMESLQGAYQAVDGDAIGRARECFIGRNTYLLSSDNWMRNNMYHTYECGAWYSSVYMKGETSEWCLETSKKGLLTGVKVGGEDSWVMYGPVFFSKEFSEKFFPVLEEYYHTPGTEQMYWEQVLADLLNGEVDSHLPGKHHFPVPEMYINRQPDNQVYEFENLEELRLFDERYQNHSDNIAMELISEVLQVPESEITGIKCLKTGMTNKSFLFKVHGKSYICRIPGPGTELLINRKQEKAVYDAIKDYGITEHVVYMNGETGYKISEYYEGARNSDPRDWDDVARCMALVEKLHDSKLHVDYSFDIRERIGFYVRCAADMRRSFLRIIRK